MPDEMSNASSRFFIIQALTALRIALSAAAIILALVHQSTLAAKLIPVATVTDILDGPLANKLRVRSDFGALFDYFADYLCYIVAPVVLSCTLILQPGFVYPVLLTVPLLTGAIRYSRNANLLKTESFAQVGFPGLLTACYALFIAGAVLVDLPGIVGTMRFRIILYITIPIMSVLMVTRVRYPKLTVSKAVGIPLVVFLLCVPFVLTRLLAGVMLGTVLAYSFVSPFLVKGRSQPLAKQRKFSQASDEPLRATLNRG